MIGGQWKLDLPLWLVLPGEEVEVYELTVMAAKTSYLEVRAVVTFGGEKESENDWEREIESRERKERSRGNVSDKESGRKRKLEREGKKENIRMRE